MSNSKAALLFWFFGVLGCAGQCITRDFVQSCINCKASSLDCSWSSRVKGNFSDCRSNFCSHPEYSMAWYDESINRYYRYSECTDVSAVTGYTSFRRTCTADCIQAELTTEIAMKGTCKVISVGFIQNVDKCLSLCLDTATCRGAAYSLEERLCYLYDCGLKENAGTDFILMQLKCTSTTPTCRETATDSKETASSTSSLKSTEISQTFNITSELSLSSLATTVSTSAPATQTAVISSPIRSVETTSPSFFVTLTLTSDRSYHPLSDRTSTESITTAARSSNSKKTITLSTNADEAHNVGFFDKPTYIAVLASIGGILLIGGVAVGISQFVTKAGKDRPRR